HHISKHAKIHSLASHSLTPPQYGHRQCQNITKTLKLIKSAFTVDVKGILKTSGVEFKEMGMEWIEEAIQHALVVSKDIPSIKDALDGGEKEDWTSAIDAEAYPNWEVRYVGDN
ncbi:hypothetical protein H2248_006868, partial [Termitomyces sp. 'cryptogamus']